MTLTKLKSTAAGEFEYVNIEAITRIDVAPTVYEIYLGDSGWLEIDKTDEVVAALILAAV